MPIQHPVEMRATPTATIVYASSSMTPFQADTLQFKAYLSSAYTDTSAYHMSSAKFDAEL